LTSARAAVLEAFKTVERKCALRPEFAAAGALARFRNPDTHTRRAFADVLEAMEELMIASRLLRIVAGCRSGNSS
jgi:hypothetical protein